MAKTTTTAYDAAEYITTPEEALEYLRAYLEEAGGHFSNADDAKSNATAELRLSALAPRFS